MANLTRIKNNQITDSTITNVKIASGTLTGDLMNPQLTFNSNLILNGNLTVAGNFTAVQSQTTQITDPLITLGMGNPGTSYDLGSVLIRGSGGNRFMGWKENAGAFVFINTAEDGTTTGNIPTTSYSNVIVGNLITIGATTHSDITLSGNTVAARGGLILDSGSGLTTLSNAVVMNSTLAVTGATVVQGTATVNALVSNGAIQGTTFSAFANATVNALTVNASAVVGSTLQAVGGIQNTVIGDTTAAAGYFTTLNTSGAITGATTLTTTGTATVNALVSNGAIQGTTVGASANATVNALTVNNSATVGSTLSAASIQNTPIGSSTPNTGNFTTLTAGTSLNTSGTATVNALVSNGAIQGTDINGSGIGTFASVVSNGAIQGTAISGSGAATFASVVSNGAIQGTAVSASANATVNALTVNASATVGTTLGVAGNLTAGNISTAGTATVAQLVIQGGLQNTPVGNATPNTGNFTTLTAGTSFNTSGTATVNELVSNGAIQGTAITGSGTGTFASVVSNGAIQGTTIGGSGTATFASVVSNGAIQGTAVSASANATVNALTVNASATVGSTLSAASIQNTPIGTITPAAGYFTKVDATGDITGATILNISGAATVNSLNVNNAATVGTTLVTGGTATVNALVSNTGITGATLDISGNAVVGNLTVSGNLITVNSQTLIVIDPIIQLNTGPNGSPLTTDNNFDSGLRTHYYDTADRSSFFGRKDSSGFLEYYSNVASETGNVVTGTYGTIKGGNLIATELASIGTTLAVAGNATVNALTVNNSATVGTTLSAAAGIQNTVIGNVTAAAGYFTTTNATGNATVNALTVNASATVGGAFSATGNAIVGNLSTINISAANAEFTNNVTVLGTLTATSNLVANTSGIFYGDIITGNSALYVGVPDYTYLGSNIVMQVTGNVNNYSQINFQNINDGTDASTDLVLTADNGTDSSNYIDLGIGSSNYALAGYSAYYPNDGYLLIDGGNLLLNVEDPTKAVRFVVGSYDETELVAYIDGTHLEVVQTTASTNSTNGAIVAAGGIGVAGAINGGSTLNVVGTATVNALVSNGAIQGTAISGSGTGTFASVVSNGAIQGTAISGSGTGTFASVVSNGAIQGTAVSASANATVAALTVNGSATVGTTLSAPGGIQATPIGNVLASTGNFTSIHAIDAISGETTLNIVGAATVNELTVNGAATVGTTLVTGGTATVNALVSNGAIQGTTVSASANATVAALTVNGSATVGATLSAAGGIQNTVIGNVTPLAATFTTLTTAGVNSFNNTTEATGVGSSTGAVRILGGVSIAKSLFVGANAALGNVTFNDTTISSNVSNTGLTINPNGTGSTVINSGLNNSRTIINGTSANSLVISGSQVGVNTSSFISGSIFQIYGTDSLLLPVGTQGDRPGSPQAGMFRYSTTLGSIEWHNGTEWQTAAVQTTVAVANTQQGNGSATIFTLPVANATTAGTIVSINGVVQQPVNAYSVSGSDVTFTEAPSSTDIIDFRVFTTTTQVTSVVDTFGTTGLFLDTPTIDNKVILFKTNGSESFSIQANSQARFTGNVVPTANITYSLGTTTNRWKDLWLSGSTIYLGNVQVKEAAGSVAFYAADGSTPAPAAFNSIEHTGTTGTGNIGSVSSAFNTVFAKATSAQYADLAENYLGDAYYEPGTVVEFGGENEVTISTTEMSPRIAGVVSTNPAYLMNSNLDGFATPVALQGRVPCKVTGAVRKGDMMVSAGNGTARSATAPVMGSVIGKALENFDGEQGVIEVVVGRL